MRTWSRKLLLGFLLVCGICLSANAFARDAVDVLSDIDIPGGDYRSLKSSTFDQCLDLCATEKRCVAFTFNQEARVCFLKDKGGQRIRFVGARSGVKSTKNIAGSINAREMDDACSFDPENIDMAISVLRDGVVPTGFNLKRRLHHYTSSTAIKYWGLSRSTGGARETDIHLLFVRAGSKRYYWCSDKMAGSHGSWTLDKKFSDFEKGYFTLNMKGCSGIGIGCSTASVYRLSENSLSKPINVGTHIYDFASGDWGYQREFKIAEVRCGRKNCSVYGDGYIEISNTWEEGYSENRKWHVSRFDSQDFFSPRVDYRRFKKLIKLVDETTDDERPRPASPKAFSRKAQKIYNRYRVAFPGLKTITESER